MPVTEKTKKPKSPGDRRSQFRVSLRRKPEGCPDGEWNLAGSGARVLIVGGNANNGGNDGAGYVNANNALSNSNTNIGARQTKDVIKTDRMFFGMDSIFPHRRDWWIGLSHIHFSTSLERVGCTSASYEVAA